MAKLNLTEAETNFLSGLLTEDNKLSPTHLAIMDRIIRKINRRITFLTRCRREMADFLAAEQADQESIPDEQLMRKDD